MWKPRRKGMQRVQRVRFPRRRLESQVGGEEAAEAMVGGGCERQGSDWPVTA